MESPTEVKALQKEVQVYKNAMIVEENKKLNLIEKCARYEIELFELKEKIFFLERELEQYEGDE